ncbi:MAG: hypothetical protein V1902_02330 [Candidatus Falkowbacteria bacterium]
MQGVFGFCDWLSSAFPQAVIGLSSVGVPVGLRWLREQPWVERLRLQLSMHAMPGTRRERIIPCERTYPIMESVREASALSASTGHPVCLNCVLMNGINDTEEDANGIADVAVSGQFYVKVSSLNRTVRSSGGLAPSCQVDRYCNVLERRGVPYKIFESLGVGIGAGCGQSAAHVERKSGGVPLHARRSGSLHEVCPSCAWGW